MSSVILPFSPKALGSGSKSSDSHMVPFDTPRTPPPPLNPHHYPRLLVPTPVFLFETWAYTTPTTFPFPELQSWGRPPSSKPALETAPCPSLEFPSHGESGSHTLHMSGCLAAGDIIGRVAPVCLAWILRPEPPKEAPAKAEHRPPQPCGCQPTAGSINQPGNSCSSPDLSGLRIVLFCLFVVFVLNLVSF